MTHEIEKKKQIAISAFLPVGVAFWSGLMMFAENGSTTGAYVAAGSAIIAACLFCYVGDDDGFEPDAEMEHEMVGQMITTDAQSDVDDAREDYLNGEIDEEELEERVGSALDRYIRLTDTADKIYADNIDEERDREPERVIER